MQASTAASSSRAWHLNRPSQKWPLQSSSRLARRAIGSLRPRMNHDTLPRRCRSSAMRGASAESRLKAISLADRSACSRSFADGFLFGILARGGYRLSQRVAISSADHIRVTSGRTRSTT